MDEYDRRLVSYTKAQEDPVAAIVLEALHQQDARTYHGSSGDKGQLALDTADAIRRILGHPVGDDATFIRDLLRKEHNNRVRAIKAYRDRVQKREGITPSLLDARNFVWAIAEEMEA